MFEELKLSIDNEHCLRKTLTYDASASNLSFPNFTILIDRHLNLHFQARIAKNLQKNKNTYNIYIAAQEIYESSKL